MFERLVRYASKDVASDAEADFVEVTSGTLAVLSRVVSQPDAHAVVARDMFFFRGVIPGAVVAAFEADAPVASFVEEAAGCFVFLGSGRLVGLRSRSGQPFEVTVHVAEGLPDELLAVVAPDVLNAPEPEPWAGDAFVEVTRTAETWTAVCPGSGLPPLTGELADVLCGMEQAACEAAVHGAAEGVRVQFAAPDTSRLERREVVAWDWDALRDVRRIVVRVNVYSADLALPGWAMSREECWY